VAQGPRPFPRPRPRSTAAWPTPPGPGWCAPATDTTRSWSATRRPTGADTRATGRTWTTGVHPRALLPQRRLRPAARRRRDPGRLTRRLSRRAFIAAHPALFLARGWAHHPYDFTKAPSYRRGDRDAATLSGISHLEIALDRVRHAYRTATKVPVYVTEWGCRAAGPIRMSPSRRPGRPSSPTRASHGLARLRIHAFAQFLLTDAGPNTAYPKGFKPYWATFQSGLLFYPLGNPKPAYFAFEFPLWLPRPRHGRHVAVWAQVRPAPTRARCSSSAAARARGPTSRTSPRATPGATSARR